MEYSFFKTEGSHLLTFLNYMDAKASIIVREVINLYFLVASLFLAVPGLYRLINISKDTNFENASSSLLTFWLFVSGFCALFGYMFNHSRYSLTFYFSFCLFFTLITGLGFLAYHESYFFFLGVWFISLAAVKALPALKRRIQARENVGLHEDWVQ
ncbi:hypothetical protein Desaci_1455 [Desulfosporosinus acidiphilus SJ4]|uniref:Uncharacterized protein n=1 Tax=Desulfosporosinus acidiphilus (strain DSM 22704 / JCM 16185 / SJ4) TaxID=646529 RepID=I4D3U8_DESAJ|nr:hypothetical protein [Desulfosporosinus acidiphilus]AFM40472.1 hypothetical protein Desaci_1455 [Desulfosporosinus acidiphilus SJ4]